MKFKTMDVPKLLEIIQNEPDIITPELEAHQKYFDKLICHRCGAGVIPIVNERKLFSENALLPNYLARCKDCACEFEPYTRIEIALPKEMV